MNIVHIVPEVYPFSSVSSIAEFACDVPTEQSKSGHKVTVFSPLYAVINVDTYGIKSTGLKTWVDAGYTVYEYELYSVDYLGVKYVFFKNDDLFKRSGLYSSGAFDYADNDIRFGTFCQAAMNYIKYHNIPVDIIHSHNWQTALVPVYKKLYHNDLECKTVLTVHSTESMGVFNKFSMETLNLPWDIYHIDFIEYYDSINFLKGGVTACDLCTTISPTFAKELVEDEGSYGRFFKVNADKITGVLNGISNTRWNPKEENLITANYSADDISGKEKCKEAFCKSLDLDPKRPLLCFITKLISARGVELILEAIKEFEKMDVNLIILGHSGAEYNNSLEDKKHISNIRIILKDYSKSSHEAYSAADIILMPSLYEPCGIGQFIGMRYGAIPVVRDTGGLHDGIKEAKEKEVGFTFDDFSVSDMMVALGNALKLYYSDKKDYAVKTLMSFDNSWKSTSAEYIKLYKKLLTEDKK